MPKKQIPVVNNRILTEVELEIMTLVWRLEKATVKDVLALLPADRSLAYTTVATVMKVLEQKGFLQCQKESYAHMFIPLISKVNYEESILKHMVVSVFDGEPVALVQRLLDTSHLDKAEIQKIEDALKILSSSQNKQRK